MVAPIHTLRHQVAAEVRKKRLIILTILFLSLAYLLSTLIFGDMGLLKYREIQKKKIHLESQINTLEAENEQIKNQLHLLKDDPYFKEKHAREDYELVKPGELIFKDDDR